jgi:hypothetical protein
VHAGFGEERAETYPGMTRARRRAPTLLNGLGALLTGRPLRATRPLHFFRPDGPMPKEFELPLTIRPGSDPPPR